MSTYRVFMAVGLLQMIRLSTTLFIPFAIQNIAEIKSVMERVMVSVSQVIRSLMFYSIILYDGEHLYIALFHIFGLKAL